VASKWGIASIAPDSALILPHRANPAGWNCWEPQVAHHRQLEIWAANCPENFENRAALVGAEIARIEGRELDAERLKALRHAAADFWANVVTVFRPAPTGDGSGAAPWQHAKTTSPEISLPESSWPPLQSSSIEDGKFHW
jgi:hypothetical protein